MMPFLSFYTLRLTAINRALGLITEGEAREVFEICAGFLPKAAIDSNIAAFEEIVFKQLPGYASAPIMVRLLKETQP